jgi:tetratricopeptide (TPR) repeat protein
MIHFCQSMHFPKPGKNAAWLAAVAVCTGLLILSLALYEPRLSSTPGPADGYLASDTSDNTPRPIVVDIPEFAGTKSGQPINTKPRPDRGDSFSRLLGNNEFSAAVDAYDRIYTNSDLESSQSYRDELLEHASGLNQGRQYELAAALLEAYLALYYSDVEALILQARVYRNAGLHRHAIESFQQARVNEHRPGVSNLILNQANIIIGEHAQNLRDRGNLQAVTELYQWLTQSQPSVSGYHIGLANAYAAQRRYDEAVAALRYVRDDVSVGSKARSLIQEYSAMSNGG